MSGHLCSIVDCGRRIVASGLCDPHYRQERYRAGYRKPPKPCELDGCDRRAVGRLCPTHRGRLYRSGNLDQGRRPNGSLERRDGQGRKECTTCLEWLPLSGYSSDQPKVDGLRTRCKNCDVRARRKNMYGLDRAAFIALVAAQGGRCAGCGSDDPGGKQGEWIIDHDHSCCTYASKTCGRCVRGLLCNHCNLVLGHVKDDPEVLRTLASYLEEATS